MTHRTLTTALLGAALILPAGASAATVTRAGDGTLVYTASPGVVNVASVQTQDDTGKTVVYTDGEPITAAPADCEVTGDAEIATCPPAPAARLELGDGDDIGRISYSVTIPVTLSGGPGRDELHANGGAATLDGGPGDDTLDGSDFADTLTGGDGNDHLDGDAGPDHLMGDAGDDVLAPDGQESPSPDVVDGGPGFDAIESDWTNREDQSTPPVTVTLAGGADDGRPGEGDDVEHVESVTTYQASTLVGTDADEAFDAFHTIESSTLSGGGGDDLLQAGGGSDTLDGGAGDDLVDGGYGDDTISGGPGRDHLYGDARSGDCGPVWCNDPYGNDTIDARDGETDSVTCGAGEDTVRADAIDTVASDCEHVDGAAAPPVTAGPGTAAPAAIVVSGHPRLRTALRRGLRVIVGDPTTTVVARFHGRRVGAGTGSGTVVVRFTRAGRRALRHHRRAKLTLVAGGARTTVTLRR